MNVQPDTQPADDVNYTIINSFSCRAILQIMSTYYDKQMDNYLDIPEYGSADGQDCAQRRPHQYDTLWHADLRHGEHTMLQASPTSAGSHLGRLINTLSSFSKQLATQLLLSWHPTPHLHFLYCCATPTSPEHNLHAHVCVNSAVQNHRQRSMWSCCFIRRPQLHTCTPTAVPQMLPHANRSVINRSAMLGSRKWVPQRKQTLA
jgi:hypothetical protein